MATLSAGAAFEGAVTTACAHCGQPAAAASGPSFCCAGCRTVYEVLHAESLTDYYRVRQSSGVTPVPSHARHASFDELDHPAFAAQHIRALPGGDVACELYLEGVHCGACVWLVERLPRLEAAVRSAQLDVGSGVVRLVYDPSRSKLSGIARRLASIGYPPHPFTDAGRREAALRAERTMLVRLGVSGAVFVNVMLLALALYSGLFGGMSAEHVRLFRWASFLVTMPSMVIAARTFFVGALASLRTRTPHMDLPISVALVLGFSWGAFNTLRDAGDIYFDTIAVLVFLLLVSRWLQLRHGRRAADATAIMHALAPHHARLWEDGAAREVPTSALAAGCIIEVLAGDRVPVDGEVVAGESSIDVAFLTGESQPRHVAVSGRVEAGSLCVSGRLLVRAERTGSETRLGELVRSMELARSRRAPIVRLADRIAGWFTVIVLLLALATLVAWLWRGAPLAVALDHTIAMLIVTCPCALGMATPLALSVALARAARAGLLVKTGEAIEKLAAIRTIVFDKTGTLTEGRLHVGSWEGDEEARAYAGAIEAQVSHPVAQLLAGAFPHAGLEVTALHHTLGAGVEGVVAGRRVRVGTPAFCRETTSSWPGWADAAMARTAAACESPVAISVDGRLSGIAGVGDTIRGDAKAVMVELRQRGIESLLASGDDPAVVQHVASALGFAAPRGRMTPEEKLALVTTLVKQGPTMMVGDGVNDAAALGAASVGVAVHGGAEASLAAADVYVSRAGVRPVVELIDGSRRTMRVVKRNIALSLAYNVVAVVLAFSGLLSPLAAALLMPLSSLTVVASSFRARSFEVPR